MKQIEAETQQKLNSIVPSTFDKAFKGELRKRGIGYLILNFSHSVKKEGPPETK
jgi:hypothetical protein